MLLPAQGSARVIRCLQDAREELSYECRATLFDAEVRMAEDIDFKYPMKRACTAEIQGFCPGVQHGHARVRALPSVAFEPCHVNSLARGKYARLPPSNPVRTLASLEPCSSCLP